MEKEKTIDGILGFGLTYEELKEWFGEFEGYYITISVKATDHIPTDSQKETELKK